MSCIMWCIESSVIWNSQFMTAAVYEEEMSELNTVENKTSVQI